MQTSVLIWSYRKSLVIQREETSKSYDFSKLLNYRIFIYISSVIFIFENCVKKKILWSLKSVSRIFKDEVKYETAGQNKIVITHNFVNSQHPWHRAPMMSSERLMYVQFLSCVQGEPTKTSIFDKMIYIFILDLKSILNS